MLYKEYDILILIISGELSSLFADRVLWRSNQGSDALALLAYDCEETVMTSDHRAVRAIFNLLMVSEEEQKGNQREAAKFGVESSKICSVQ